MPPGAVHANLSERIPRIGRFGVVVPVGIPERCRAAFENQKQLPGILPANDRIQAPQVSVYLLHFAQKVMECIDEVDAGFVDQETRVVAEEGLPVEIGALAPSIAESGHQVDLCEFADRALALHLLDLAIPRLPSEILV